MAVFEHYAQNRPYRIIVSSGITEYSILQNCIYLPRMCAVRKRLKFNEGGSIYRFQANVALALVKQCFVIAEAAGEDRQAAFAG